MFPHASVYVTYTNTSENIHMPHSTPSLPLFQDPLWPRGVEPDRIKSMGQIELFNPLNVCKQMTDIELLMLNSNA